MNSVVGSELYPRGTFTQKSQPGSSCSSWLSDCNTLKTRRNNYRRLISSKIGAFSRSPAKPSNAQFTKIVVSFWYVP